MKMIVQVATKLILMIKNQNSQSKLVGVRGWAFSLLKRGQGFKPRSRMKSSLWPALYLLRADPVRAEISLSCGTGLKIPPTVGAAQDHLVVKAKKKKRTKIPYKKRRSISLN